MLKIVKIVKIFIWTTVVTYGVDTRKYCSKHGARLCGIPIVEIVDYYVEIIPLYEQQSVEIITSWYTGTNITHYSLKIRDFAPLLDFFEIVDCVVFFVQNTTSVEFPVFGDGTPCLFHNRYNIYSEVCRVIFRFLFFSSKIKLEKTKKIQV